MPRVLARRHPGLDLLSLTLSEAEVVSLVAEAVDGDGQDDLSLPPEHIALDLTPATAESMLRRILAGGFPDEPGQAAHLAARLASDDADDAPEVMPGVVFYHAHVDAVSSPEVYLGVCSRGAPLPHTGQPARVLLVLLAPASMAPDAYLRQLAVTAQLVRSEETVQALLAAETPEAGVAALFASVREDLQSGDSTPSETAEAAAEAQ